MKDSGHSHAIIQTPITKLTICSVGNGFTAESNVLVAKSQKIFGQKNASIAAAIWSSVEVSDHSPQIHLLAVSRSEGPTHKLPRSG